MIHRKQSLGLIFFILLFVAKANAQLENIIVEKYYISDANDATDSLGGILEPGSITYRIYVDMKPGYRLKKLFGDANHTLRISSSEIFFNNLDRGQSFGNNMSKSWLGEGTVALDSWLTLGQTTKTSPITNFGVLKNQDNDGSFIGGINNDGGSSAIAAGLIANNDPAIGILPTIADGFMPIDSIPQNWGNYGILDLISHDDSTIFGSLKTDTIFISNNAGLQNSGVIGVIPDENQVLIAQLTTKGKISLELNIEIIDSSGNSIVYVAKGISSANGDTLLSPFLKYPLMCGCDDPQYLEYNPAYGCNNRDSCKTRIVYGCMDPKACNYNANANFNVQTLCCYPGYCNDRDLNIVCPDLVSSRNALSDFKLFPNPANDDVTFQIVLPEQTELKYDLYNAMGQLIKQNYIGLADGIVVRSLDISGLENGLYYFRLTIGNVSVNKMFEKH